eukprot:1161133-Pelagomonas_calceolata.AAC.7
MAATQHPRACHSAAASCRQLPGCLQRNPAPGCVLAAAPAAAAAPVGRCCCHPLLRHAHCYLAACLPDSGSSSSHPGPLLFGCLPPFGCYHFLCCPLLLLALCRAHSDHSCLLSHLVAAAAAAAGGLQSRGPVHLSCRARLGHACCVLRAPPSIPPPAAAAAVVAAAGEARAAAAAAGAAPVLGLFPPEVLPLRGALGRQLPQSYLKQQAWAHQLLERQQELQQGGPEQPAASDPRCCLVQRLCWGQKARAACLPCCWPPAAAAAARGSSFVAAAVGLAYLPDQPAAAAAAVVKGGGGALRRGWVAGHPSLASDQPAAAQSAAAGRLLLPGRCLQPAPAGQAARRRTRQRPQLGWALRLCCRPAAAEERDGQQRCAPRAAAAAAAAAALLAVAAPPAAAAASASQTRSAGGALVTLAAAVAAPHVWPVLQT